MLVGNEASAALSRTKVTVFGLGGVGSWCAEALVRSGIGNITLVDFDTIDVTNINRQIEALVTTVGQLKTEALSARLREINPDCNVTVISRYFSCKDGGLEKAARDFNITNSDYVIDAIDSIESKLDLIECAAHCNVPLFSSMGMARRLDPCRLQTADIWKTAGCPLARAVREGLRKRRLSGNFTAVYSDENILTQNISIQKDESDGTDTAPVRKAINGSAVTVTAAAGLILASLVLRDVCAKYGHGGSCG